MLSFMTMLVVDSVLDCLLIPEEKNSKMLLLTELDPPKVRSRHDLSHFERPQALFYKYPMTLIVAFL